jgi:hypothetical protein
VAELEGDVFLLVVEGGLESVADLVAVDAGLDNLALPIEFRFKLALAVGDVGDVERGFEAEGTRLFVGKSGFVGGVVFVKSEGGSEGALEAGEGFFGRILLMLPRAEATVSGAVGVEDEGGEGEVVVELEAGEIEGIGIDEAEADEVIEEGREFGGLGDGTVDTGAGETGDTAEDDKDGLLFAGGLGEGFVGVVVNPAVLVRHLFTVGTDGSFAILDGFGEGEEREECKEEEFHRRRE